jgi:hypothetical protein
MRKVWFWILRRMSQATRLTSGSGTKRAKSVRSLRHGASAATQSCQAGCQEFFPARILNVPDLERFLKSFLMFWIRIPWGSLDPD